VREWSADGTTVVYWPGLNAGGPRELDAVAPEWTALGLRVLAVSPPGLGETPRVDVEGFRPSALAALTVRLLDVLGLEAAAFVGFSWGGFVGCRLAALAPARLGALVLVDAGHLDLGPRGTLADWVSVAEGIRPPLPLPDAAGAAIWGIVREPPSETWPVLARGDAPILLVTGGDPAEAFARAVPRGEIRVFAEAGHEVLQVPEAAESVGSWLAQQNSLR